MSDLQPQRGGPLRGHCSQSSGTPDPRGPAPTERSSIIPGISAPTGRKLTASGVSPGFPAIICKAPKGRKQPTADLSPLRGLRRGTNRRSFSPAGSRCHTHRLQTGATPTGWKPVPHRTGATHAINSTKPDPRPVSSPPPWSAARRRRGPRRSVPAVSLPWSL